MEKKIDRTCTNNCSDVCGECQIPTKKMEKKQTAVDWLVERWKKLQKEGEKMSWNQIIQITELAKELEKQQIIDAVDVGFEEGCKFPEDIKLKNAEQYYTENYEIERSS